MTIQIVEGLNTLNVTMLMATGTLSGRVTNSNGDGIEGVSVIFSAVLPPAGQYVAHTDANGDYTIGQMVPGDYNGEFQHANYLTVFV